MTSSWPACTTSAGNGLPMAKRFRTTISIIPRPPPGHRPARRTSTSIPAGAEASGPRGGDLRGALGHYDMSCEAGFNDLGCYEAANLYLQNRQLRDDAKAKERFTHMCDGNDPGRGPYFCKYLGWMHLTATGVRCDLDKAWSRLALACFLHNDADMIDPEGVTSSPRRSPPCAQLHRAAPRGRTSWPMWRFRRPVPTTPGRSATKRGPGTGPAPDSTRPG